MQPVSEKQTPLPSTIEPLPKRFRGMHIVLLGSAGAGKDRLSKLLVKEAGYFHLYMGEILRQQITKATPLGLASKKFVDAGLSVPNNICNQLFEETFSIAEREHKLVIIDGYIQNQEFVNFVDEFMEKRSLRNKVCYIYLEVSEKVAKERITDRQICSSCTGVYSKRSDLTHCKVETCGKTLISRPDDRDEAVVQARIRRFFGSNSVPGTKALIDNYACRSTFHTVNAEKTWKHLKNEYRKLFFLSPILAIGYPVVDSIMNVKIEFLKTLSVQEGKRKVVPLEIFTKLLQTDEAKLGVMATGGCSANTIKGLALLGENTVFLGSKSQDEMGSFYYETIRKFGVEPVYLSTALPTTQVACLVTGEGKEKEKTMVIYLGAEKFNEVQLTPSHFAGIKLLHLDGYFLYNDNLIDRALQLAKDAGAMISLDLGTHQICTQYRERILELISKYVDILFGNESEIEALTGKTVDQGILILKKSGKIIVAKLGPDGCWVATEDKVFKSPPVAPKVMVDVTGAGDNFASGFLFGFLNKYSLEDCAHFGNLAGSATVETYGAELSPDRWRELRRHMLQSKVSTNKPLIN